MSTGKSRIRIALEVAAAVVVLALVFAWSESLLSDRVGPDDPAVGAEARVAGQDAPGSTAVAREVLVPVVVEALGTVRPLREASVSARVAGVVRRVAVEEGARVAEGDVLVELAADELGARSRAALRQVDAAEARLAQARRDLERTRALQEREAATAVELEQARTAVEVTGASLEAARQGARGEATMASYAVVRAPFAGRVVARHADPGDLAAPGVPLVTLEGETLQRLEVPLDARLVARVRVGDRVPVAVDAVDAVLEGTVAEIEPAADPGSRTVRVEIDLPASADLRTGQFGRARFAADERPGVAIPEAALRRVGGLTTVRVIDAGRVVTRHVRLGAALEDGEREVLSGVAAGERVLLDDEGAVLTRVER